MKYSSIIDKNLSSRRQTCCLGVRLALGHVAVSAWEACWSRERVDNNVKHEAVYS